MGLSFMYVVVVETDVFCRNARTPEYSLGELLVLMLLQVIEYAEVFIGKNKIFLFTSGHLDDLLKSTET